MTDHTYASNSLKSCGYANEITGNKNYVNLLKFAWKNHKITLSSELIFGGF